MQPATSEAGRPPSTIGMCRPLPVIFAGRKYPVRMQA
jgi:hypothetical protein